MTEKVLFINDEENKEIFLDIKPIHEDLYDCLQNTVLTIAKYWDIDPTMMFANIWGIGINTKYGNSNLSDKIQIGYHKDVWNALEKYNGIKITSIKPTSNKLEFKQVKKFIHEQNKKKKIVAICIDISTCPWMPDYSGIRYPHYIIVRGFKNNNIIGVDPSGSKNEIELYPMNGLKNGYSYLIFEKVHSESMELLEILSPLYERNNNKRWIKSIIELSQEIQKIDYDKEVGNAILTNNIPILFKLSNISNNRINIAKFFMYLNSIFKYEELAELANMFNKIRNKWNIVKTLMIKYFTDKDTSSIVRTSKVLENIAQLENDTFDLLVKFLLKINGNISSELQKN
ncbi:hypothetical protein [Vallitalea sp.]|jgi:hypothetical protein|uniref:hypothetical protein n=1 Tax=Vallitalea sp. TaxID=1882829 RepID=UPI0025F39EE6|nr:hypothetical protein [Vallitalea sp.]MCT4686733.1 hypothetical protein [Vallitalea sp.]